MITREIADLSILIIDDDPSTLEFQEVMLAAYGFKNLHTETNPARALNNLRSWKPDLILLDYLMEEMTGIDFLRKFRDLLAPEELLPVIMVTADESREIQEQALVEGASDFLTKPIQRMDLVLRVRNLLRARLQHLQLKARNQELDREVLAHRQLADNLFATTARFGALLQNLQAGVLVEDENRRRVLTNQFFSEFFGASPEFLGNRKSPAVEEQICDSFLEKDRFLQRTREVLAGRVLVSGEQWELVDGRFVERDYVPVFHENHYFGHLWTYRDITRLRHEQTELANARDEAIKAANFKARFVANMSHEIRTPINGVLGMLSLLTDSQLDPDQRTLLDTAQSSADSLLDIVNDVLDFSKIEAGKMPIQEGEFAPGSVLDETILMVARQAENKGLELISLISPDVPREVRGDGSRVRQILANLLSNAVKFTASGEVIARISVEGEYLRFSVADTGIGITSEDAARLFQPFIQADDSITRRHGGTGLGLAISRQLVEIMGGQLNVDSVPGQGSIFWFTLPLREVPAENRDNTPAALDFSEFKVMVVQENQTVRNTLLTQLESWRISGDSVRTGEEAIQALKAAAHARAPYQLVFVDAQLPDTTAADFAVRIKDHAELADLRLVLITAFSGSTADRDGFVGVVTKPVRQSHLLKLLIRLQSRSTSTSLAAEPAQTAYNSFPGLRVLVVDDSAVNREVARRWLEKWECEVNLATSGREAVDAVKNLTFDLVLMDCQMPEMDGYSATREIRLLPEPAASLPIIALTAHVLEGDIERCLAAGMNGYLAKPIRPQTLHQAVQEWTTPGTSTSPGDAADPVTDNSDDLDPKTLQDLRDAVGDDGMPGLAEMFFEQVREYERSVRQSVQSCDTKSLREAAHALKGLSRQFGAESVAQCCLTLEKLPAEECSPRGLLILEDLNTRLGRVRENLNDYIKNIGP